MSVRLLLLVIFLLSTLVIWLDNLILLAMLLAVLITSILISPKRYEIISRMKPLTAIYLLVILFQLIFNTSEPLSSRFYMGLVSGLKITLLSLLAFYYTLTVSPAETVSALSFLPPPFRLLLTITFSLIPVISADLNAIRLVQSSRGYRTNRFNPIKSVLPALIPLLHRSFKRAEQLAQILEVKGYDRI